MNSARARTQTNRLAISFCVVVLVIAFASAARGQATPDLFTKVETLTLSNGTPASGVASISGNTAVVGNDGVVHVFRRQRDGDHWLHTATLTPSDATSGFGGSVAVDGRTIVVGADSAAFVFRRTRGFGWQEITKLTGDMNPGSFGASVAISGTTAVVGAPVPDLTAGERGPGVAYVFERDHGGPNAWGEAARLMGPPYPPSRMVDVFGISVGIDEDTVIVGAFSPRNLPDGFSSSSSAFVFSRESGGPNAWGMVATLPLGPGADTGAAHVSISGDTAVVGAVQLGSRIFQRDRGGPDAWGWQTVPVPGARAVSISGDLVAASLSFLPPTFRTIILARHQGGEDAWGPVGRISSIPAQPPDSVAVSGDTLLLGNAVVTSTQPRTPIDVYVADTDRDGLRDGLDPCPRDPLNNVAGDCQRASAVHPVLDELIAQGDVTSETHGRRQIITATFTNTSDTAVQNPFFEVTELTGHNVLLNGDAGRGRIGATLSPDVGDGVLSPGESMTVTFRIRLRTPDPFQFFVTFHGDPLP